MTTFRDVANAFPSPYWSELDRTIDTLAEIAAKPQGYADLLKSRYRNTWMRVSVGSGKEIIVSPTVGGLQGDAVMAGEFAQTYNRLVDKYIQETRGRGAN